MTGRAGMFSSRVKRASRNGLWRGTIHAKPKPSAGPETTAVTSRRGPWRRVANSVAEPVDTPERFAFGGNLRKPHEADHCRLEQWLQRVRLRPLTAAGVNARVVEASHGPATDWEAWNLDRAGQEYWDALWEGETLPAPVDPRDKTLGNYVFRKYHELFTRVLPRGQNVRLLEVGCARSRWLPYFAAEHGYEVTGLDYSTTGCEQARQILAAAGVEGRIVEGDLFSPPEDLLEAFDVVVSFGLVEHFDDTTAATAGSRPLPRSGWHARHGHPQYGGIARRPDPAVPEPPGVRRPRAA